MHFEFAQQRLTEPHRLSTFELARGAIKVQLQAQLHHVPGFGMTSELLTNTGEGVPQRIRKGSGNAAASCRVLDRQHAAVVGHRSATERQLAQV